MQGPSRNSNQKTETKTETRGKRTCIQLLRIPNRSSRSSPTNITGASPVVSVNKAIFDEVGGDGFSDPAAYRPEDMSGENARLEMIPGEMIG